MNTKKKFGKRILSLSLAALTVIPSISMSMMSVSAATDELTATIDTGKEVTLKDTDDDDYYEISNADELYAFAEIVNGGNTEINVILTADITVNEGTMTENSTDARVWKPIGNLSGEIYSGTFDGNNKTISGLYFNDNTVDQVGLFGWIDGYAQIKNVGVINSYFNGKNYVGGVVAFIDKYAAVIDCYNASTVKGASNVGGVVGANEYSTLVENCYNTGNVYGDKSVGGIVGYACGLVETCYNTGSIECNVDYVGGIVGTNFNDVKFCYNAGSVKGDYFVGGIVGDNSCGINCCYNVGSVSGNSRVGGIVGINNLEVKNSYNAGSISGDEYVGGVFGQNWMTTIKNCYNIGSVSGNIGVGGVGGYSLYGVVTNNYYLDSVCTGGIHGEDVAGSAEAKTEKQFASGEVAYLLQGEEEKEVWGQKIGTDKAPVFYGDKVYQVTNCKGDTAYSNTNKNGQHNCINGICTDCGQLDNIAGLGGYSISLGGNIAVKFYMNLSEEAKNDANTAMVITVPSGESSYEVRVPVSEAERIGDYYVFTCEVAAKEMTSEIKAQVVTSTDKSGVFYYSVQQYCKYILENADKYEKEVPLAKAMLNYGAYAQEYFGYKTDSLANSILEDAEKVLVDTLDLSAYTNKVSGEQEGIKFHGGVLSLKSETAIKLYFKVDDDVDINALGITVNGEKAEAVRNGKYYEVKISDIPAGTLTEMFEIKVGNLTVNYGAFSYGKTAMDTDKEALKNTVKALYAYDQAAVAYKGGTN